MGSSASVPLLESEALLAERCEERLALFVRAAWPHLDPVPLVWGRHIDVLCEYLEAFVHGEIRVLIVNMPPGHMKSTLCSVLLNAWCWIKRERARRRFVGLSYRQDLALRDGDKVRDLIRSSWYQSRWGHVGALRGEAFEIIKGRDKASRFVNSRGGYRFSTPVSGVMGEGGDYVIFDDPHSVEIAESDDVLDRTIDRIMLAIPTRVRSPEGGLMVVMQRLRERDLTGVLVKRGGDGLVHLCLPARYERDHPHVTVPVELDSGRVLPGDFRERDGELLFPELFPEERLADIERALRAYGAAGQLQQRPAPRDGGMFQRGDFTVLDRTPQGPKVVVRGWDLGATEGGGSHTAGVRCAVYLDTMQVVVEHVVRGQWGPLKVDRQMKATAELDGAQVWQDVPQDPGQAGKAQRRHIAANLAGHRVRFSPETGAKETRAEPLSSQAEAGNVYLLRGAWNDDFVDEADLFPRGATDQIDAWSRAYARLLQLVKQRRPPPSAPEIVGR